MVWVKLEKDVCLFGDTIGGTSPLTRFDYDDVYRFLLAYLLFHYLVKFQLRMVQLEIDILAFLGYDRKTEECPEGIIVLMTDSAEHNLHIVWRADLRIIRMCGKKLLYASASRQFRYEGVTHHLFRNILYRNGEIGYAQLFPFSRCSLAGYGVIIGTKDFPPSVVFGEDTIYQLLL